MPKIAFQGPMTIQGIDTARIRMIEALSEHDQLEIDCTQVAEADVSFIQMLLAAHLGGTHAGKVVRLAAPAEGALRAALERGGFMAPHAPSTLFWRGE